ncbi:hypothetical protein LCGC14_3111810, partial [marine sediment metagenome]
GVVEDTGGSALPTGRGLLPLLEGGQGGQAGEGEETPPEQVERKSERRAEVVKKSAEEG